MEGQGGVVDGLGVVPVVEVGHCEPVGTAEIARAAAGGSHSAGHREIGPVGGQERQQGETEHSL